MGKNSQVEAFLSCYKPLRNAAGNTIVFIELNDGSDIKSLQVIYILD